MKVFVVEDSLVVRGRLVAMLGETQQVEVVGESDNPADAVSGILCLRPDVVVLDIKLSGGSGIEVLKQIRQRAPSITTIMFSNYADPGYRQRYLAAGANYFFDKSGEFEKVRDVIKHLIAARRSHPQND